MVLVVEIFHGLVLAPIAGINGLTKGWVSLNLEEGALRRVLWHGVAAVGLHGAWLVTIRARGARIYGRIVAGR